MQRPDARAIAPAITDVPPTPAADLATSTGKLRLNTLSLIGVSGSPASRLALLREPDGEILTVQVGDRTSKGQVKAIGADEVILARAGKTLRLSMPAD